MASWGYLLGRARAQPSDFIRFLRLGMGADILSGDPKLERIAKGNALALCATGTWTARFVPVLERMVADAEKLAAGSQSIFIDVSEVAKLDTFGAWLIERLRRSLTQGAAEVQIVVLITFLIGCIIAQQGIFHFRKFGADIFVVDMLGVLVLREIGVLLVAIMF